MELLRRVCALIAERGFHIGNIDATVLAQAPKLKPYISRMAEGLAAACGVGALVQSVKATTEEGLGFTGAGRESPPTPSACSNAVDGSAEMI